MKEIPGEMKEIHRIRDIIFPGFRAYSMKYKDIEARLILCRDPGGISIELISGEHRAEIRVADAFNDDFKTLFVPKMQTAFEVFHQVTQT